MEIKKVETDKKRYLDLLLLADEQEIVQVMVIHKNLHYDSFNSNYRIIKRKKIFVKNSGKNHVRIRESFLKKQVF